MSDIILNNMPKVIHKRYVATETTTTSHQEEEYLGGITACTIIECNTNEIQAVKELFHLLTACQQSFAHLVVVLQ